VSVVVLEVFHDGVLQFGDAPEGAPTDAVSGDLGEETLDHVEPRSRVRCEVQVEARMRLEPALYGRGLVGGIVVHDEMQVAISGGLMIELLEKANELSCRWRGMQVPMMLPSSMFSAANRVVVPLRL
jgi:hypothetical protein